MIAIFRPNSVSNLSVSAQNVDFPQPGGPTINCPKMVIVSVASADVIHNKQNYFVYFEHDEKHQGNTSEVSASKYFD